jgi:enoyl-CoA hydratase/carnithine racemase
MVLEIAQQGPVRTMTLNRPEAMNAISGALAKRLLEEVHAAEADSDTRVVIVTGSGDRAFCTGADLKERRNMAPEEKWAQATSLWRVNEAIWRSPKAFVAAINGWCLGGGFELALFCDFRLACDQARFGFPEMKLGAFPGAGGAVILPRLIGRAAARPFFFAARQVDASEALTLGLLEEVTASHDLLPTAVALANRIADCTSPLGLAGAKALINGGADLSFDAAAELNQSLRRPLEASADYEEGLRAHFEKRKPRFVGR